MNTAICGGISVLLYPGSLYDYPGLSQMWSVSNVVCLKCGLS